MNQVHYEIHELFSFKKTNRIMWHKVEKMVIVTHCNTTSHSRFGLFSPNLYCACAELLFSSLRSKFKIVTLPLNSVSELHRELNLSAVLFKGQLQRKFFIAINELSLYQITTYVTSNSSGDEIANVNFLYDDIVHALKMQQTLA